MQHINGKVLQGDIDYVLERGYRPIAAMPCPLGGNDSKRKINPHVTRFLLENDVPGLTTLMSIFHIGPVYYEHQNGSWRPMHEVCSHVGNHGMQLKPDWDKKMSMRFFRWLLKRQTESFDDGRGYITIPSPYKVNEHRRVDMSNYFFTSSTFYPDEEETGTTTDDSLREDRSSSSWNAVHDSTTGDLRGDYSGDSPTAHFSGQFIAAARFRIYRGFYYFDTSSITATDTIDAATMSIYTNGLNDHTASTTANFGSIVQVQPTATWSDNTVALGDFDVCGSAVDNPTEAVDSGDRIATDGEAADGYNDWTFNATGRGWIARSGEQKPNANGTAGITYLGGREGADITDEAPTSGSDVWNCFFSEEGTDTSKDPKLAVTHTAAGGTFTPKAIIF